MNPATSGQSLPRQEFLKYCRFFIPEKRRILMFGGRDRDFLERLQPAFGVVVNTVPGQDGRFHDGQSAVVIHDITAAELSQSQEKFDFVIIDTILASISDIQNFLTSLQEKVGPASRIIINSRNPLLCFLPGRLSPLGGAGAAPRPIRLRRRDLMNFLTISGYEVVRVQPYLLFPWSIPLLSSLFNRLLAKLPLLQRCCLRFLTVARPSSKPDDLRNATVSVVITCRDEEGNIADLVRRIPAMGDKTEIVFVEGHSTDDTVGKIKEMIAQYPEKDIRLYHQTGIGQGDAFRLGCERARGDFLVWLEADLTTPPEEARHIWEAYADGHGEYINGSRFVYPMAPGAMPPANYLGNRFFSLVLSLVTGQRFTDTLCGFKGIPKNFYTAIVSRRDFFDALDPFGDFLLVLGAVKHNLKIAEVPVHYLPRQYGTPKAYGKSFTGLLTHAWLLFKICWRALIEFRLR